MSTVAVPARRFASLVKIEHTVFALPYAYVGAILAVSGWPGLDDMIWITVAMAGARSFAMAANRLIDATIDARNPRTAKRELPAGLLSRAQVVVFALASLAVFLIAVWQLDPVTRWLWPFVVVPMLIYPYLKRFTPLCHLWLGAVDGLAPVGAWVAITGHAPLAAWLLGGAVALWIAGFDVIYAALDLDIDRAQGLHSLPADIGLGPALTLVRVAHVATVVLLVAVGTTLGLGPVYYVGVALVAVLLGYENSIVRARRSLARRCRLLLGERRDRRPVPRGRRARRSDRLSAPDRGPAGRRAPADRARLRRTPRAARGRAARGARRVARAVR